MCVHSFVPFLYHVFVVSGITKAKGTEPTKFQGGNLSKFLLDNKYYSAEVEFVSYEADSLENMPSLLPEFSSTVDAFILAFDTSNVRSTFLFNFPRFNRCCSRAAPC